MLGQFTRVLFAALLGIAALTGTGEAAPRQVAAESAAPQSVTAQSGYVILSFTAGANGKCLDVYNGGAGPQIQMWWCNGWANQDWTIDSGYHGGVRLRPHSNTGMCVDAFKGRGVQVVQYRCDMTSTQEFTRVWLSNTFALRSVSNPSLCLDIYDLGYGNSVMMWDCHYGDNQRWNWQGGI